MPASRPEEICCLFQRYMREGDIDSVAMAYKRNTWEGLRNASAGLFTVVSESDVQELHKFL